MSGGHNNGFLVTQKWIDLNSVIRCHLSSPLKTCCHTTISYVIKCLVTLT